MCGIAGQVAAPGSRPDREAVAAASLSLAHRGPDGDGIETRGRACLAHRRLSIIDVAGSAQPWASADGRHTLVFNGEIYNYLELRRELEAAGVAFRSRGDTEVLLEMFRRHGEDCLARLNGMFAFAVWDAVEEALFLARDRLGEKPLFYGFAAGAFCFASELEALAAFPGLDLGLDPQAVDDYFAHQFIGGDRTIYRGARRLPPAHRAWLRHGRIEVGRYWSVPLPEASTDAPLPRLCDELGALVQDSVRLRLRSDVPLGAFLSGGIDSSIVVGTMARLGVTAETFTVGFGEETFDEREAARDAARHFGTRHRDQSMDLGVDELWSWLRRFGEPFADPSALPTWHLCRHTRRFVTVALSGDGADELFGGYRRYRAGRYAAAFGALPLTARRAARSAIGALPETDRYFAASASKSLKLFADMTRAREEAPADWLPQTFSRSERARLLRPGFTGFPEPPAEPSLECLDPVSRMMQADMAAYLPEDILVKVDRMSMAHGLEVRPPFLDHRLVEFAARLPVELKLRGGIQKFILREAFAGMLPPGTATRRKQGFAVPLAAWFRERLRPLFDSSVLDGPCPDCIDAAEVRRLWREHQDRIRDHGFRLWSLLAFFVWHSHRPGTR